MNSNLRKSMLDLVEARPSDDEEYEGLSDASETIERFMEEWDEFVGERWTKKSVANESPDHVAKLNDDFTEFLPDAQRSAAESMLKNATTLFADAVQTAATAEKAAMQRYLQGRELMKMLKSMIDARRGYKRRS